MGTGATRTVGDVVVRAFARLRAATASVAGMVVMASVAGMVVMASAAGLALITGTAAAGAAAAPPQPLTVQAASLAQDGQDLVWQVELAQPFSPRGLARDHRSLCLLIEGGSGSTGTVSLCIAGPGRGERRAQLVITPAGGGSGRAIAGTVARPSNRELTATFLPASIGLGYRALRWQVTSTLTAPGCTPVVAGSSHCATLVPAQPALLRLHTPRLVGCVASGPDWVFQGPSNVREIALTFDDGPWSEPPSSQFVSLLAREHVPATFFEIGEHIPEYDPRGTVEREMLADGDMIGDHTWSHPDMVGLSAAAQRSQLSLTADAIRKATGGFEPCLFRAPYGAVDPSLLAVARSLGFATIQWDIDPRDWALPGVNAIIDNVDANARNGGIVIQHFGGGPRYETLDALPREIADLRARGFKLVTITQMLGYKLVYR